ncbi:MAG: hypothetical protein AB8B55_06195, partial [Mariniblastus sp.]
MSFLNPRLLLILVGVLALFSFSTPTRDASRQSATPQDTLPQEGQGIQLPANLTEDPLTATDHLMMSTATASVSEWLGPLAPIAISP